MYGNLDISVSGMVAQRQRLETIASNLANRSATRDANGDPNPYRRKFVVFQEGDPSARNTLGRTKGVHVKSIEEDMSDFQKRYDPSHPDAKPNGHPDAGYVYLPNVDPVMEQVDALDAQRAYEANVAAADASKALVASALRLLA
jgi:flagellar basal-body rod protein FlgC